MPQRSLCTIRFQVSLENRFPVEKTTTWKGVFDVDLDFSLLLLSAAG